MEDNELIEADSILPAIKEHSEKIEELRKMFEQIDSEKTSKKNDEYLDYRKIDLFVGVQQAYYGIFAQNKIAQEYVPFEIIYMADKWALKMFRKDLKKQVEKKYKKIIKFDKKLKKDEKRNLFIEKIKKIFRHKK